jgi:Lon protease-like protein
MSDVVHIPMFPLAILPLPGELVPLHIFEPRYQQLLSDAEANDIEFGIYCNHEMNVAKLGSLMKLESVIKRYADGQADIIVKCIDIFSMSNLLRTYRKKTYPGGDVRFWEIDQSVFPGHELYDLFLTLLRYKNIQRHLTVYNLHQIALELNLDVVDRYRFLTASDEKREPFLVARMKFQLHLLHEEERSKDKFHLN